MLKKITLLLVIMSAIGVSTAFAQVKCDGDVAIVRHILIKPGSLATYMKAQETHIAWYRKNGFTDNRIYSARVMTLDSSTRLPTGYSDTELLNFHINPPGQSSLDLRKKDPAGWDAFVKLYATTSEVKTTNTVCMPKHG